MVAGVGHHAEIPDVLRFSLWNRTSPKYAGLGAEDYFVLGLLLDDVWKDNNGLLTLSVSKAAEYGMDKRQRRDALERLSRAGIILRIAGHKGARPERWAVHFWPLAKKPELYPVSGAFREWANREREKYSVYFDGDIPENYRPIPEPKHDGIL